MTHSYAWRDSFICVTHIDLANVDVSHVWDMTPSYVSVMCETSHSYVWRDLIVYATWNNYMYGMMNSYVDMSHVWDMTHSFVSFMRETYHSYVRRDSWKCATYSFIRVTWPIHMYDTHRLGECWGESCARHDSFIYVTWLLDMCAMSNSYDTDRPGWCYWGRVYTYVCLYVHVYIYIYMYIYICLYIYGYICV